MTEPGEKSAAVARSAEDTAARTGAADAADVARVGRTDAAGAGLVRSGGRRACAGPAPEKADAKAGSVRQRAGRPTVAGAGEAAEPPAAEGRTAAQGRLNMRAAVAGAAAREADESDELEGTEGLYRAGRGAAQAVRVARTSGKAEGRAVREPRAAWGAECEAPPTAPAGPPPRGAAGLSGREARKKAGESADARRIQSRRTWLKARAVRERAAGSGTRGAAEAARKGAANALASAAATAAGPLAGVLAGVLCFVLAVLAAAQIASAIFGFWSDEASKASLEGLPPYITYEMVEAALECQEEYGHPAGCTLAQIICESGQGERLSALAERDKNLFGIKWAPSFFGCPEVAGKNSWATSEEYGGETVGVMADFTVFKGHRECVVFRSRVLLASPRYAENALVREAIAACDSDKMAEGLKDAGYATSSTYVDSLKAAMDAYGLRSFDGMSLDDFKSGAVHGDAIVAAAVSQLGVPYVWGGSTPGVGLDCSGLTQYCYAQAGISIPRYSEDQASAGRRVPLSEAEPGDILWRPGHVAIYAGGDEYIHEPQTGDVCRRASGITYFTCAVRYR
ncbi:NlpC/P60 family protein [Gordonibacter sp. RACS_AR49]|uniref:C40 family peptidase n=1 Tax=Gordonibacter sp. RACS_AR49 TaxID=2871986 RepID=UPI00261EC836|nr:NlpC/P60 family protein [Gordonibacter sp. RACS_AR49]MDN4508594.1 C40 family peptidase [Gordonibacter sp. RACS_AR49]